MTHIYEEVVPIERVEAEQIFQNHDVAAIPEALVRTTFYERDWRWVQEWCLSLVSDSEPAIQKVAITCLGHLARIHGTLDKNAVITTLEALVSDPALGGIAEDALDDIAIFVKE